MKRGLIALTMFLLVGSIVMMNLEAADEVTTMGFVTPDGYDYSHAESCVNCKSIPNAKKHRPFKQNAVGVKVTYDDNDVPIAVEVTGDGWVSSKHARSMDTTNANTYCAYCHAPTYEGITTDADESSKITGKGKNLKPGVACKACHPSHGQGRRLGAETPSGIRTQFGNLKPGTDPSEDENWRVVPKINDRYTFDGKKANQQCLFCHVSFHDFAVKAKNKMIKKGTLMCIDCHMAVYNKVSYTNRDGETYDKHERFHNFKVEANGPLACAKCHSFSKKELSKEIAEMMGAHRDEHNKLPTF